ncbi:sensor histidine kinase [Planktothricoides raciborskii]|uniref:histidine kinase n=1 Tax=Planktothricoides raciborskii FACHB-1370 TaxID=2949576 RepID=A0ABR8EB21_9CYAN|nr:response regulator [Planktothricoides raciborskii]MBD2543953.1 response regulator [Planktothricoides raciborskii FACHB-1370]MBD2582940.1 response regulator [Planktothricoides raciborskii FACHB-1261]
MNKLKSLNYNGDILIVDDHVENLQILFSMLTDYGYEVRRVLNGIQALNVVKSEPPDLILLDILMPEMDGYEVCRYLKAEASTASIPVIFLTALDDEVDKLKAFEVGGIDYITKPFHMKEVMARIENQLTIQRQRRAIAEQNEQLKAQNIRLEQLNTELIKLNSKLEQSNQDLEQFAYIASHDLRSPLQTIIGFAQILNQKYQQYLDEKGKHYLDRIITGGYRMNKLIGALLEYSRIGCKHLEFKPVDGNKMLAQVLESLQAEIESSHAVIVRDNLPNFIGDEVQIEQLFQNLISNGIKYRNPQVKPQIKITVEPRINFEYLIGIHDNGIGICAEDFQRIFQVFQRLHNSEQYPGTGIGLAVCQKIIDNHGGRLWVESEENQGTSFYFTLRGQEILATPTVEQK